MRATARALRNDIKEIGGIRNLSELCDKIIKTLKASTPTAVMKLRNELRSFEQNAQNRQFAAGVSQAVWETYSDYSSKNSNHFNLFPTTQEIAGRFCSIYIETQLHSKIKILDNKDVSSNWKNENFIKLYKESLEQPIKKISESLAKDPSFKKPPRFSKVKSGQLSTEQLLHSPISLT